MIVTAVFYFIGNSANFQKEAITLDRDNTHLREDIALYRDFESGIEESLPGILDNLMEGNWGHFTDDLIKARFLVFSSQETGMLATLRTKETKQTVIPLYTTMEELLRTHTFPPDMRISVMTYQNVCVSLIANENIDGVVINPAGRHFPIPAGSVIEILHLASWKRMMRLAQAMGAGSIDGEDKPVKIYH